jgi:hypothetical protein
MKRKWLKGIVLGCSLMLLMGCGTGTGGSDSTEKAGSDSSKSTTEETADASVIEDAVKELESTDTAYMIYDYMSVAGSSSNQLETVLTDGTTYSEVPYTDSSSSDDTDDEDDSDSGSSYILYDWVTSEGAAYTLNSAYSEDSEDSKMWIEMPDEYGEGLQGRKTLYASDLLDADTLTKADTENITLGMNSDSEEVEMYVCDVSEEKIKKVLEVDTLSLVDAVGKIADTKKDDENYDRVKEFVDSSREDYALTSAYATGKAYFGIKDGKLRYVRLETGGAGVQLILERVVLDDEVEDRTVPEFEGNTITYYDLIVNYLDYVDSYSSSDSSDTEATEETESTEEVEDEGTDTTESTEATEENE